MRNIRLTIEYDGTNYGGWQKQNNAVTIQEELEKAVYNITKEVVKITGSSRTDAGVHARGFVANFFTEARIPEAKIKDALNSQLPDDIVVLASEEVGLDFHSRYNCIGKTYSYTLINKSERIAIGRNYALYTRKNLHIEAMQEAASYLIGKHDFSAFRNLGSSVKTSVRTITQLDVIKNGDEIKIYASADGFLYNMVRIIVGTLLDVGTGKIAPVDMKSILLSGERSKAGVSVPPQGLCLEKVYY